MTFCNYPCSLLCGLQGGRSESLTVGVLSISKLLHNYIANYEICIAISWCIHTIHNSLCARVIQKLEKTDCIEDISHFISFSFHGTIWLCLVCADLKPHHCPPSAPIWLLVVLLKNYLKWQVINSASSPLCNYLKDLK